MTIWENPLCRRYVSSFIYPNFKFGDITQGNDKNAKNQRKVYLTVHQNTFLLNLIYTFALLILKKISPPTLCKIIKLMYRAT